MRTASIQACKRMSDNTRRQGWSGGESPDGTYIGCRIPMQVDCDANGFVGRECIYCCAIWSFAIGVGHGGYDDDKSLCEDVVSGNPSCKIPRALHCRQDRGSMAKESRLASAGSLRPARARTPAVSTSPWRPTATGAYFGRAGLFYGLIIGGVLLVCLLGCCLVGGALYLRFWRNKPKPGGGGTSPTTTEMTATTPPTMPAAGSMKFDPYTGKPLEPKPMFDPYTGKPLDPAAQPVVQSQAQPVPAPAPSPTYSPAAAAFMAEAAATEMTATPPTMPAAGSMKFDPFTGKPIEPKPMFDPYTGKPLDPAAQPTQTL